MKRIILIAPLLAVVGCHKEAVAPEPAVTPVRVSAVDLYQPKESARYSATILPGRQVNLAFRVSGFVTDLHRLGGRALEPGDVVQGGTVLAKLREEDYQNSSKQAQSQFEAAKETQRSAAAQVAQAEASRVKAAADFKRAQILIDSQSLTRPEYDSARAQLDVAVAQLQAAKAQLESASAQIRNAEANVATAHLTQTDTALLAPFTASVMQRNVEVGMLAGPSVVAYSLADISSVKAAFGVPDSVVVQLRAGRPIAVTVEALGDREFRGFVTSVAAVADADTRLFQVEVSIANRGFALKPGMIASLSLQDAQPAQAVPVIPLSAVIRDRNNPADFAVMVVEGKVAKTRHVGLGATYGELLAVTSGLKPGDLVIRAGGTMVNDGEPVEVIR
jgi:multidrug efflux pump subunit AcrA (membrane-fusion protein)